MGHIFMQLPCNSKLFFMFTFLYVVPIGELPQYHRGCQPVNSFIISFTNVYSLEIIIANYAWHYLIKLRRQFLRTLFLALLLLFSDTRLILTMLIL